MAFLWKGKYYCWSGYIFTASGGAIIGLGSRSSPGCANIVAGPLTVKLKPKTRIYPMINFFNLFPPFPNYLHLLLIYTWS